jgi:putative membrane protein
MNAAGIAFLVAASLSMAARVFANAEATSEARRTTPAPIRLRAEPVASSHSIGEAPSSAQAVARATFPIRDSAAVPDDKAAEAPASAQRALAAPANAAGSASAAKPGTPVSPEQTTAAPDNRDLQFVTAAFEYGRTQLWLGELAKTRAETEQIKAMGVVLSSTQAEENKKLLRLAAKKGITLPRGDGTLQKEVAAKLDKLSGAKFEKQLLEEMLSVNQRAVANYELASATQDPDIKTFVEEGLPLAKEKLLFTNKMTGTARRSDKQPGFRGDVSTLPE